MHRVSPCRSVRLRSASRAWPSGQSLVEFVLVLPVLLLILVLAADFGRLFFTYIQVTNAAREAANYASVHAADTSFDATAYATNVTAAATGEVNVQGQAGEGGFTVDAPVCFDAGSPSTIIACNTASDYAAGTGNQVRVTVHRDFTFLTPLISAVFPVLPLGASATAPVLNPPVAPATFPPGPLPGSLVVTKVLSGDLTGFSGGDFTFSVSCNGQPYGPVTINVASGSRSSSPITGIPANAVCTVTETSKPSAGTGGTWDAPAAKQATILTGAQSLVTITNTRTYTPPQPGSLVVTKVINGTLTGFSGGDFTFSVSCDGQAYGPVTINLSGGSKASNPISGIPAGATCTVTETSKASAGTGGSWNSPGPVQVTITSGTQATATITNTRSYTPPCTEPRVTISPATTSANKNVLKVDFTGTAAGNVTGWSWDFGDGTPAVSGSTANHQYAYTKGKGSGPQTWTVTLTTTGSCPGSGQATVTLDWR